MPGHFARRIRAPPPGEDRPGVKDTGVLSESVGRQVLKEAFEAQGYRIQENYLFAWEDWQVELDGYDPEARVGYEYLTQEDGVEPAALDSLVKQNHCSLFLIDEASVPDAPTMLAAVFEFFRQIESDD